MVSPSSCGFLGIGPWHGDALDETRQSFETFDPAEGLSIEEMVISSQSGRPGGRQNDAIVLGKVVEVEPGQSCSWTLTDDGAEKTVLPFGDPDAEVISFHLNVDVTEVVVAGRGTEIEPRRIQVGVTHSAEKRGSVEDDFQGIGEIVIFLRQGSPVYDCRGPVVDQLQPGADRPARKRTRDRLPGLRLRQPPGHANPR